MTLVVSSEADPEIPDVTRLLVSNYPNPFATETTVRYELPARADVRVSVFDYLGRRLRIYDEGSRNPGAHMLQLTFGDLPNGVYLYKVEAALSSGSSLEGNGRLSIVR